MKREQKITHGEIDSEIVARLKSWARKHDAIAALWLFGSRAKGTPRQDSDYDIALELMPAKGKHDWALGDFICEADQWKADLRLIVRGEVSLVHIRDDLPQPFDPRQGGVLLWSRKGPPG